MDVCVREPLPVCDASSAPHPFAASRRRMGMTTPWVAMLVLIAVGTTASATTLAEQSLRACRQAETATGDAREGHLRTGLSLARTAIAANPRDARAHLGAFCNQGRLTQDAGVGLSALADVRELMRLIDDAERLAPNDADVLTARGAFLLALPRLLGGDPAVAESLLRRSLAIEPSNCEAAGYLARALEARGRRDEAAAFQQCASAGRDA